MRRRKPLRSKTPLRAKKGKGLGRGKGLNPVNRKRRKKERLRAYGPPERREIVTSLPCVVPRCNRGPIHQAHIPSGSGTGRKGDARFIVPLCAHHHWELDNEIGPGPFEEKYGVDLRESAQSTDAHCKQIMGE